VGRLPGAREGPPTRRSGPRPPAGAGSVRARRSPRPGLDGRKATAFCPIGLEGVIECVRRGLLGELGPDTPVSRAGALNAAVDVMANDERKDDRMPAHHVVLTVLRH
jgi:hypothetical protein